MDGTCRKSHWPALYLKDGLLNWISTTSGTLSVFGKRTEYQNQDLTIRVPHNTGNLGLADSTDFTVEALQHVEAAGEELPSPAEVADTVVPVIISSKRRDGQRRITDEASNRVGVQSEEEGDEQVVGVPERLERLLPDTVMCRAVHQQHAEQHDMPCDATRLGVVDLDGRDRADLCLFNIEEAMRLLANGLQSEKGVFAYLT
jgi:hypothetical protein